MAWLFFSNPGKFVTRAQIAGGVWGSCEDVARALHRATHLDKLRKKLRLSPGNGLNLKTVYALGYKLDSVASIGEAGNALACVEQFA